MDGNVQAVSGALAVALRPQASHDLVSTRPPARVRGEQSQKGQLVPPGCPAAHRLAVGLYSRSAQELEPDHNWPLTGG